MFVERSLLDVRTQSTTPDDVLRVLLICTPFFFFGGGVNFILRKFDANSLTTSFLFERLFRERDLIALCLKEVEGD